MPSLGSRAPTRSRAGSIHWTTVIISACSLFSAIAFALGHHFFYTYWDHRSVRSNTQQEWIIRTGSAFASIVNALLVVPTSYAFVQQIWLSLGKRPAKIPEIDTMFAVLGNAFGLFDLKVWYQRPTLALTAIIVWAIPIGSIIPPGTLTVVLVQQPVNQSLTIATFNYTNRENFMPDLAENIAGQTYLTSAGPELNRISLASLTSLTTLQQDPPAANCTFVIEAFAPALQCDTASPETFQSFLDSVDTGDGGGEILITYFSWVPSVDAEDHIFNNLTNHVPSNSTTFETLDFLTPNSTQIFVFIDYDLKGPLGLVSCSLQNVSYTLRFDFQNTRQTLTVLDKKLFGNVVANPLADGHILLDPQTDKIIAYLSIMEAFGRILTGIITSFTSTDAWGGSETTSTLAQSTALYQPTSEFANMSLAFLVEQMFQNLTFSLLSSDSFTYKLKTSTANNAIVTLNKNIYSYRPFSLLVSYGVVIAVTLVTFIFGLLVVFQNGSSYNRNFSTFLRTTRNSNLTDTTGLTETMTNGAEPCDKHLYKVELIYRRDAEPGSDSPAGFVPTSVSLLSSNDHVEDSSSSVEMITAGNKAMKSPTVTIDQTMRQRFNGVNTSHSPTYASLSAMDTDETVESHT